MPSAPRTGPPRRGASTRARPSKAPLSEEAVVDAALEILRRDGLEAVTMRRVAAALDTGAASLYVYVRNRDGLLGLMFDRVAASVPLPEPDPDRWREQMRQLCVDTRRLMESHPGIASVAVARIPLGPGGLRVADRMMGVLLAGGIAPQDAAWACDNLSLIMTAAAVETDVESELGTGPSGDPDVTIADIRQHFADMPREEYPRLAQYADEMTSGDDQDRFLFAIDTYLDGLVARSTTRGRRRR